MRCALAALLCASVLGLMLNLEQMWLLAHASQHAMVVPTRTLPAPHPPPLFDGSCVEGCASWFAKPSPRPPSSADSSAPRVARVSVSRQDAALFRQLGLEVQQLCAPTAPPADSRRGRRASALNTADLLLLEWQTPSEAPRRCERARLAPREADNGSAVELDAQVLWGSWTAHMQFFDRRLRPGQLINSMMGLEHDTLGTPLALARSHQRCLRRWGSSACNFSSVPLVMHSHHDVAKLESAFGEDYLSDLSTWQDISSEGSGSIWIGKQGAYQRSLTHYRASMFEQKTLLASTDVLPPGLWVVMPWPTQPLLWRHHRFILRTWVVMPSVAPLRVYLLQDAWAHIVAKPYRSDQLMVNYKDRCVHLWSISGCDVTHAHRILRCNHGAFTEGIVGLPPGVDHMVHWRRVIWPLLEKATVHTIGSVWLELNRYEKMLLSRERQFRRVAQLALDWIIDEGGKPLLLDVDVDGVNPLESMPLSSKYATDALRLLGVRGYQRAEYQEEFVAVATSFCGAERCSKRAADGLQDLVDEAHHAGAFARVFPLSQDGGCAPYCHFFSQESTHKMAHPAATGKWPSDAGEENLILWSFLRRHHRLLPQRAKPASRPIYGGR